MYKKQFYAVIIIVLLILTSIGAFNYVIDPSNIFSNKIILDATRVMIDGHNVKGLKNWDEVALKKQFIKQSIQKPDIIVLGSSRSMEINSNLLNCPLHNYSLSGGGLEKMISLWYLSRKNAKQAQTYIIELDDWVFVSKPMSEENTDQDYLEALSLLKGNYKENVRTACKYNLKKYTQMISWEYFNASYRLLKESRKLNVKLQSTDNFVDSEPLLRYDGSYHHGFAMTNISKNQLDDNVRKHINISLSNYLGKAETINNTKRQLFELWINKIQSENKHVIFLLPPYNPDVYDYIKNNPNYKVVIDTEKYIRNFAAKNNIKVVGSYNPKTLGLSEEAFFDGMHMKEEYFDSLFGDAF